MKKLLSVLALVFALVGCAGGLNVEKFTAQLEETEYASVKVKYVTGTEVGDIEAYLTEEDKDFRDALIETLNGLDLTKAESQDKIFGTPVFYIDLHNAASEDYARFSVYESADASTVVVLNNEGYVNYTVNAATEVEALLADVFNYYTAE